MQIIVVGSGFAGLGAAYSLKKLGIDCLVLEAEAEPGGRVRSLQWGGAWIDRGAEFITDIDLDQVRHIVTELGLSDQLVTYPGATAAFDVWRDGKAHPLSVTEYSSFLSYGGMSRAAKWQLLGLVPIMVGQMMRNGRPHEPWRATWCDDVSVEQWLTRVCPEFLEYVIEPTYEIYCGWKPATLGRGMFAYVMTTYRQVTLNTFKEGLGQFTRTLAKNLNVLTSARVTRITPGIRPTVEYLHEGKTLSQQVDAVLVAVQGSQVLNIVENLSEPLQEFFKQVRYTAHELPFFSVKQPPVGVPKRLYFPRREDAQLAGIGYDASSTAPDVKFLRVDVKTDFVDATLECSNDETLQKILDLAEKRYPGIKDTVTGGYLSRWREGLPIFDAGYCRRMADFIDIPKPTGVYFAGDYLAGASTGAAYISGQRAVEEIKAALHILTN